MSDYPTDSNGVHVDTVQDIPPINKKDSKFILIFNKLKELSQKLQFNPQINMFSVIGIILIAIYNYHDNMQQFIAFVCLGLFFLSIGIKKDNFVGKIFAILKNPDLTIEQKMRQIESILLFLVKSWNELIDLFDKYSF